MVGKGDLNLKWQINASLLPDSDTQHTNEDGPNVLEILCSSRGCFALQTVPRLSILALSVTGTRLVAEETGQLVKDLPAD